MAKANSIGINMHVCIHHHTALPIKTYGGVERLVFWHMKELIKFGHKVTFIGPAESQVTEYGIQHIPWSKKDNWQQLVPDNTDVIHQFFNDDIKLDIPYLINIGGNGFPGEKFDLNTVFVSKSHARNHGSTSYVNNCLDMEEYPAIYKEKEIKNIKNLLFLAKASWRVKNLKQSVKIARQTNKHLHICGGGSKLFGWHPLIHNHGMVGGQHKLDLMRECDALLFAVRWHEPFGLAIIEAMTQGLPVFGSSFGSLPDLIVEGTGRTFYSHEEIIEYFNTTKDIYDREYIRNYALKNFSMENFTNDFLEKYKIVMSGEKLNKVAPEWIHPFRAGKRLPF